MDASHATTANIRAEMGRQRINQADLAQKLGVHDMWLSRRLNDRVPLTLDDLVRLADALGVPVASLFAMKASA